MGKQHDSFEIIQKSVVRIKDKSGQTWGTGFFLSKTGHLLTCAHVVDDAGGWENVRIMDQPVECLYAGSRDRDDFCLLQVEDYTPAVYAELETDFDPSDEFLSPGFSNDDFYGAPISGKITAFARCGKLGDQKLIRLQTFSDAQRIEGGQSGAPVFVYKKGKWRAIGLIAASEDLQGGLAIPSSTIQPKLATIVTASRKRPIAIYATAGLAIAGLVACIPWLQARFIDPCQSSEVAQEVAAIAESFRGEESDFKETETSARKLAQRCAYKGYYFEAKALIKQKNYGQAVKAFEESLTQKETPEARFGLGASFGWIGQYEKGIKTLVELEKTSSFSKSFDPTSKLNRRNVLFNLAIFHHFIVSENLQSSEISKDEKRRYLKEAINRYQEIFKQTTRGSCGDNAVGECIDENRAESADGLAQVYSLLYEINKDDRYSLHQSIVYLEEGFLAKSQTERQNTLSLLESVNGEEKFQKDINYIRSEPEFKQLLEKWQQKLRSNK